MSHGKHDIDWKDPSERGTFTGKALVVYRGQVRQARYVGDECGWFIDDGLTVPCVGDDSITAWAEWPKAPSS